MIRFRILLLLRVKDNFLLLNISSSTGNLKMSSEDGKPMIFRNSL